MPSPPWHGWATPAQVRQMMIDMAIYLKENHEVSDFILKEDAKKIVEDEIESHLRLQMSKMWRKTGHLGTG